MTGPLNPGEGFAGYRIVRRLGVGGMGQVYLARHPRLPRQDALKVLTTSVQDDPSFRMRFDREAEIAADLFHPHIVPLFDRGEEDGRLWISMAYVEGSDAAVRADGCEGRMLPVPLVVDIVTAVGSALDYAHERGLLHRDVKPGNILLTDTTTPHIYLADFGIAKAQDSATGVTGTGAFVGSLPYVAPEQIRADPHTTGALDQYQLACTAFELLAGEPPYAGPGVAAVLNQHLHAPPPSPRRRRPGLLASVDAVFTRAMAKDPAARYPSCAGFAAALAAAIPDTTSTAAGGDAAEPGDPSATRRRETTGETIAAPPSQVGPYSPASPETSGEAPTLRHTSGEAPTVRHPSVERFPPRARIASDRPAPPTSRQNPDDRFAQNERGAPTIPRTRQLGGTAQPPVPPTAVGGTSPDDGPAPRTPGPAMPDGIRSRPGGVRNRRILIGAGALLLVVIVAVVALIMSGKDGPADPDQATGGSTSRTGVAGVTDATSVAAGTRGACAVAGGSVYCWGENSSGQLGDGTTTDRATPTRVPDLTSATTVSTDSGTTCAVNDDAAFCWGSNSAGQLGNGSADDSLTPVQVTGLAGVTAISTHSGTTCAVADGAAYCWGFNDSGQVGDATTDNRDRPTRVGGLSDVTAISTSHGTTCAIAGAAARCWGLNEAGQHGDGTTAEKLTIARVTGLADVTAIDVGYGAACAISGGTPYCWGLNDTGQLGDGTTENRSAPVRVVGVDNVSSVTAGVAQACAISGGAGYCWGSNGFGQLGDNATENSSTAVRVADLTGVSAIGAGEDTACAVSGGTVYCWGELAS